MSARWWSYPLLLVFLLSMAGVLLLGFAAAMIYPTLPTLDVLTDYKPKIPLRVYSADSRLIGEFGEERRAVVKLSSVPKALTNAILAAEDERFFQHGGVDYVGVARAALSNFVSGGARQGASTITMQVARNFFLTKEKTFTRKFNEMLLAFKIEAGLSKEQILELYINQIYLGQRAYGFAAAAQIYYGKSLDGLGVAELAMLAGLPKAPSRFNPIVNPARAKLRQQYVLRRMQELGTITAAQASEAARYTPPAKSTINDYAVRAEFLTELVRLAMVERYGEEAYTRGFRVYTTLNTRHQEAAFQALRKGLLSYDHRHGFRGPEKFMDVRTSLTPEAMEEALQETQDIDGMQAAVVTEVNTKRLGFYLAGGERAVITGNALQFVSRALSERAPANLRLRPGAIVRVAQDEKKHWQVTQVPQAEAAVVSADSRTGAIRALVGGFDFGRNKFNHVTQALRQPGSSFKPFIYSAALERGITPATIFDDSPLTFTAAETGSEAWEPKNFDGKFDGPLRVRAALAKSKNLVAVRILQEITPKYAQDYISRFGFDPKLHPPYLTMALGAGSVTPLQMAGAYAAFANGGYRVQPYFIERIEDDKGNVLMTTQPAVAGEGAERVIDPRNAFLMSSLLREVVKSGTAVRALSLKRGDLAGKTGTTNDFVDAWFCGFQPGLVAVAWVGFDQPKSLGRNETGGSAALPIWIDYMAEALKNVAEEPLNPPEGVIQVAVDPVTGIRRETATGGIDEYFYQEFPPPERAGGDSPFPVDPSAPASPR
jgi:penicillin-binding protein 1A